MVGRKWEVEKGYLEIKRLNIQCNYARDGKEGSQRGVDYRGEEACS